MSQNDKIIFILVLLGSLWVIMYSVNLVWRHPAKFKELTPFDLFYSEKGFLFFIWTFRVVTLLFGLIILFLIVMTFLSLVGLIR